ncbi:MAG TPA: ABC transporter ATP-binding protein [Candidatus Onthomorpha intestinigallinarum]|uniref:ABC transporter ATP-binding protein n=1 Tax=Candidatus Onthomorpha intestinigallinarum TaxID=2840880 RepID=A0A9D1UHR0_9BACT|nr:ABC transporter ATP-binding protein [Candidatus Onthomorpha intestinigallinarum]
MDNGQDNGEVLRVEDLHIAFRNGRQWREVVEGVGFSLKRGETLGLVGESGSGKSVTALAIMGLLDRKNSRITRGSILFGSGTDLAQLDEKTYRTFRGKRIAMIFQEPMTSLNPVKKCGGQVVEMIRQHLDVTYSEARTRTLALFEEVLLPDALKAFESYPHQLSGGQKQRVMIAMAMACNPDVLIADEPTTALDVSVQKAVLQLMRHLQDKYNTAIVFISHDLGGIRQIADRVAVIYRGRIVEQGDAERLFALPVHPYTKGLLASRPPMDCRPRRLKTVEDFLSDDKKDYGIITSEERKAEHERIYSQEPLLRVRNLTVDYGRFRALDGISFDVYRGETLGLVGESGCGKTTVGRALMRLIESAGGDVLFEGRNIGSLGRGELKRLRKEIQIVFQDPYSSLNPRIRMGEAIEEPLKVHATGASGEQRRRMVYDIMEKVGLKREYYSRYPHEFSGGQRQRIGIARALVLNPKLVICDESVSALDVSVQAQVLNLLGDLKREFGFTYIFISHDLAVVKYMSDRMIVMRKGAIEQQGEADSVYAGPQSEYTRMLIDSIPT